MLINVNGNLVVKSDFERYDSIVFFGASMKNKNVIEKYDISDRVCYVVDSNDKLEGEEIDGYKIYTKERLGLDRNVLIISVLTIVADEIIEATRQYENCELVFYLPGDGEPETLIRENNFVIEHYESPQIIHLFPDEKFLIPFYTMLEEHFLIKDHLFIVDYSRLDVIENQYKNLDFACKKNKNNHNILILNDFGKLQSVINKDINCNEIFLKKEIDGYFNNAKKIILHSTSFSPNYLKFIQYNIKKGFGEKMVWVCWGGDIYFSEKSFVAIEILKKINYGVASPKSIDVIQSKCDIKMKTVEVASYAYVPNWKRKWKHEKNITEPLHILLGHYAAEDNNLEFGLNILHRFREENIKIYCTLSYGNERYRESIIKKGKEMFGDKFIPIVDYIELSQYWLFLESIDLVVYPMIRFAAGTTLTYLNYMGKKIYMKKEMADIALNLGIHVMDIEELKKIKWLDLINFQDKIKEKDISNINDKVVSCWRNILYDETEQAFLCGEAD